MLIMTGCSSTQNSLPKDAYPASELARPNIAAANSLAPQTSGVPQAYASRADLENAAASDAPNGAYILSPGDLVDVTVWGHPELSGKRTIGPDGEIQIPFVGAFRIDGLTAVDAGNKLTHALQEDYLWTAVSITVETYGGNRVIVLGHVARQGAITFPNNPTLLEALATAGTVEGKDQAANASLPMRCAIVRGRDRILWIDMRPMLRGQDFSLNIPLHQNDLIYVPDPGDEVVYVMGQVKNPGPYALTPNMNFIRALSLAGGPGDNAQQGKIILARPSQNLQETIDLEDFAKTGGSNYQLQAGDIVYVPKSGLAKVGYVLQQLNPITSMAVFAAVL